MKLRKRVLWALGALALLSAIFFMVFKKTAMRLSPPAEVTQQFENLSVEINYSRPYMKGRLIFGSEKEGALQPYGKYWRVGANEATRIKFSNDVLFGGQLVKAGEYSMYSIPGDTSWEIALNSKAKRWGFKPPDAADDVVRVMVTPINDNRLKEQFTISFIKENGGLGIVLEWANVRVIIPVKPA